MTSAPKFHYVKNAEELLSHGLRDLRSDALSIFEQVLDSVNPYKRVRVLLRTDGATVVVGSKSYDLRRGQRVWFLGAGKASFPIAKAVEDALGPLVAGGVVVCKGTQSGILERIELLQADHPIPSAASVHAAESVISLCERVAPGDVLLCGITGGSSALMTMPCAGLELRDLQDVTRLLLTCGANIVEINSVRKHVSQIGGGRLAMRLHPKVRIVNITASDVIGDALDYITDPTVPDTSTLDDARETLTRFDLWERVPERVAAFFRRAAHAQETPKTLPHEIQTELILTATSASDAACAVAKEMGYYPLLLSSCFEGESSALGQTFAAIAQEIIFRDGPVPRPCAVIGGGETVVTMTGFAGRGGPNQEFTLAGALHLPAADVVILGADTDGTDGPTDYAGGLCDSSTKDRSRSLKIDLAQALREHRASDALYALGDAIVTGATGSNVNDLKLMLVRGNMPPARS